MVARDARQKIAARIAALRQKTKARGCTEAEALAAAELAARLMADHGLSDAEIEMTEAVSPGQCRRAGWKISLSNAIARVTNTACVEGGGGMLFLGREPGPEIAVYLRDVCFRAVQREVSAFQATAWYRQRRSPKTKRKACEDFREAMVFRLGGRLEATFRSTISAEAEKEANAVLEARFPDIRTIDVKSSDIRFDHAVHAGWVAGGSVHLAHGVDGGAPAKAIGRPS